MSLPTILAAIGIAILALIAVYGWHAVAAYRREHAQLLRRLELAREPSLEDRLRRAGHI